MEPKKTKVSERTRKQLEAMSPEKRAKAEAAVARTRGEEYRAVVAADRQALDEEYRRSGKVATAPAPQALVNFVGKLKERRGVLGLTLAEVAERSGIDQPALSRLENGHYPNPTIATLGKYAAAMGMELEIGAREIAEAAGAN